MSSRHDVHVIVNRVRRWKVTQGGRTLSNHRTQETAAPRDVPRGDTGGPRHPRPQRPDSVEGQLRKRIRRARYGTLIGAPGPGCRAWPHL